MTTLTTEIRALLALRDVHLCPDCGETDSTFHGLCTRCRKQLISDNEFAALAQAVEALEDQPPPADAELLASANRALMERPEEAELELLCIRGWVEDDWAIDCTERPTARAVVAMYAKLNGDARQAERALSEARAEVARLHGRVKVLESFAEDRCHDADPNGRWCHCCPDPDGCPVAEDRAAHLDGEKEPTP